MNTETLAARRVVLDLLESVLRRRVPLDDALDQHRGLPGLEPRDRAFVRLLTATVIRRLGQIDAVVLSLLARPDLPKAGVLDILRVSAAQLLFLGTPAHAAVDTGVELAVAKGLAGMKGLINAVLRRLAREGADLLAAQDAGRLNTPDWLWLAWRQHYGTGHTRAIVDAHLVEAPLDITVKGDPHAWAERLEATVLPTGTLRRAAGGSVTELPGFNEGAWWVQDAAAALPARLLGDVAGLTVIDLCAAPGGKTAQLAAAGAKVTAVDRSAPRLDRLSRNMERLGLSVATAVADATKWQPDEPVDAVLLDAPCSATGTIRRHPDVARLKTPEDVGRLSGVQRRLLDRAIDMVKPGGLVVYCTCSLQPEEGEEQLSKLLSRRLDVMVEPIIPVDLAYGAEADVEALAPLVTDSGDVRTTPGHWAELGGLDGFFMTRLRRTA
ncbi:MULTISPECIES: RsmB/NOP family class I SAM-dependent RNA methyltransferase [Nitrospirillum]|uniref:16S rRNA (Cytosine967-C5)-methyltransferase n=1 Tax=Nitrospirillum amazonense TaxID=28077 RepID=A0A560F670_9PROT|nr:transcription antitermination factor NusB [Nitrospirillum amazonense]MEC4590608.1 transcription antitermination factor NusB [Nitrospirillum amazonense]TWB17112.1 16S rRNA (cytosine967-C5)-methyltransferase [Nitrospirillum amazonense]